MVFNPKIVAKTKNNTSAYGKSRVYITGHPEDMAEFMEVICEEIFSINDCAIYHETDFRHNVDLDVLEDDLDSMNLCIVIVTSKFLTEKNRAKDKEFGIAMKRQIPVLPIVMEADLASLFSEKMEEIGSGYGNIQYLDHTVYDDTAVPYFEKLEKRLNAVLVSAEEVSRIRASFKRHIFLSYRKKDRRLARELMATIHRIPECADIAIWYDEYLSPGERWNDELARALKGCDVVTLMVTPSLLEEKNYIVEHEYPDAVSYGKKVIGIETEKTDKDTLREMYPGLSRPISGYNEYIIESTLNSAVEVKAQTPEDMFLLGLAYLEAIDVERNIKRGLRLISKAAKNGCPEAIIRLADMYYAGRYVEKNYRAVVSLMGRYAGILCKNNAFSRKDIEPLFKYDYFALMPEHLREAGNVYLTLLDGLKQYEKSHGGCYPEVYADVCEQVARMKWLEEYNSYIYGLCGKAADSDVASTGMRDETQAAGSAQKDYAFALTLRNREARSNPSRENQLQKAKDLEMLGMLYSINNQFKDSYNKFISGIEVLTPYLEDGDEKVNKIYAISSCMIGLAGGQSEESLGHFSNTYRALNDLFAAKKTIAKQFILFIGEYLMDRAGFLEKINPELQFDLRLRMKAIISMFKNNPYSEVGLFAEDAAYYLVWLGLFLKASAAEENLSNQIGAAQALYVFALFFSKSNMRELVNLCIKLIQERLPGLRSAVERSEAQLKLSLGGEITVLESDINNVLLDRMLSEGSNFKKISPLMSKGAADYRAGELQEITALIKKRKKSGIKWEERQIVETAVKRCAELYNLDFCVSTAALMARCYDLLGSLYIESGMSREGMECRQKEYRIRQMLADVGNKLNYFKMYGMTLDEFGDCLLNSAMNHKKLGNREECEDKLKAAAEYHLAAFLEWESVNRVLSDVMSGKAPRELFAEIKETDEEIPGSIKEAKGELKKLQKKLVKEYWKLGKYLTAFKYGLGIIDRYQLVEIL